MIGFDGLLSVKTWTFKRIYLTSPQGTRSTLLDSRSKDRSSSGFSDWPFMSTHFWGENPTGKWILEVHNDSKYQKATLTKWALEMYGTRGTQSVSGKVEKVEMSIHKASQCGGNSAYIELLQNSTSCQTKDIGKFGKGSTLVWTASTLDTCLGKEFDVLNDEINFKTMSNDGNDYCPKTVTITISNGFEYKKEGIVDWVDNGKNNHLQSAKRTSKSHSTC